MIDVDRAWLTRRFGDGVTGWIDALPGLVGSLTRRWDLTVVRLMPGGNGAVLLCETGDGHAVLKLTPDLEVASREARALTAWAHTPAVVGLLDADLAAGALLLEAITPGTPAPDPARVVPALHTADPTGFPPLRAHVDFLFEVVIANLTGSYHPAEHEHARELASHDVPPVLDRVHDWIAAFKPLYDFWG